MEKVCLFIDDDPEQRTVIDNIPPRAKEKYGLSVTCIEFNPTSRELQNENLDIDIQKVQNKLQKEVLRQKIDLIACDYDLGDDHVNGLDIIEFIRQYHEHCPVILYSGNLDKIIGDVVAEYGGQNSKAIINKLKRIFRLNISDFVERQDYTDEVINLLKKTPLEFIIHEKLMEYGEYEFKSGYPVFKGLKLHQIAKALGKKTLESEGFKRELIEQAISHMIALNKGE